VPGLGDFSTGDMSFLLIYVAWQRGLPRLTLLRRFVNLAIDTLGGLLPVAGDAFDVYWKSNRMNYNLLMRGKSGGKAPHNVRDWLFLITLALGMLALIMIPIIAFAFLLKWILHR